MTYLRSTQFSRTCRNTRKLISEPKYNCIYNLLLYIMYALIKMYGKEIARYLSFFFIIYHYIYLG